ncbi:uncharacterized protein LOC128801794 isoform X3 [Vidua chalybeata]|nr:uncharacterized protein LOC128801794 isoform X3 [Vidua chalybeata]
MRGPDPLRNTAFDPHPWRELPGHRGGQEPTRVSNRRPCWGQSLVPITQSLSCWRCPPQLLKVLVDVVATLGKVAATVTGPQRDEQQLVYPKFLRERLRDFAWSLCKTLNHHGVTSWGHHNVPSLGQALATLGATPGATRADVRASAWAWQELDVLAQS